MLHAAFLGGLDELELFLWLTPCRATAKICAGILGYLGCVGICKNVYTYADMKRLRVGLLADLLQVVEYRRLINFKVIGFPHTIGISQMGAPLQTPGFY